MLPIFMPRRLAAKYVRDTWGVRCSEKWLAKLVVYGGGPRYVKNGRAVLYRRDWLETWVLGRLSDPRTSSSDSDAMGASKRLPFSYLRSGEGLPFVDG
jgi:hypothetical protein